VVADEERFQSAKSPTDPTNAAPAAVATAFHG
jgi:hypothetical protein